MPSTLIAAAVSAFGWLTGETVLAFVARTVLFTGISRIIAKRALSQSNSQAASGRTQQAPVANNVLPVVYGTAFIPPTVTDAKISTDQKYMWYVCALAEVTDTTAGSGYTFGDIYYDGKLVAFDGSDTSKVVSLTTNGDTPQVDTSIDGKLYIWKFPNGSSSGISTGGSNAITLLSDSSTGGGIPTNERWNGPIYSYTEGATTYSPTMTNTAFIVIRVEYNDDAGLTGLGQVQVELTNSITKPGDAIKDYLLNSRYGCAIPLNKIDTASLTALNTYSDELITYTPVGGGSATQARYRINGPIDPANDCLTNLQQLVDACDSWLQYSELSGTWGVVINQSYTDYTTLANLYLVDSSNLVGGVNVNPIDLNNIYNEMEVQYPDYNVQDQYNFPVVKLQDYYPQWMSPNEPVNRINLQYPQVNNYIQANYLGVRRLLQGRLDLTVQFTLDYSGIQLVAGDVIKITLAEYGWTEKLFRVSNVQEQKTQDGNLFASITAFQYDDDVYNDDPLTDFVLDGNTGLSDPNIISQPSTPIITTGAVANGATKYFTVSSNVPSTGSVLYMDFNVGTSSNIAQHKSYSTVQIGAGTPYTANSTVSINVSDLSANTYYWSATARNKQAGRQSNSSNSYVWSGPSVTTVINNHICNASSVGNLVTLDTTANIVVGYNVAINSGNGQLAANTTVANINSANTFTLSSVPTVALSNACLNIFSNGGINSNNIQPNSITNIMIVPGSITSAIIGPSGVVPGSYTSTNITVNSQGLITAASNGNGGGGGGGAVVLAGVGFAIDQYPSPSVLPINITGANIYNNVPVYINGTSLGSSDYEPFYSGTSSTANGYYDNSTGSFLPSGASRFEITNGTMGWYSFVGSNTLVGIVPGAFLWNYVGVQLIANANTTVQITPWAEFSTSPGLLNSGDKFFTTIQLVANQPYMYNIRQFIAPLSTTFVAVGYMIRNTVSGTTVNLTYCDWAAYSADV